MIWIPLKIQWIYNLMISLFKHSPFEIFTHTFTLLLLSCHYHQTLTFWNVYTHYYYCHFAINYYCHIAIIYFCRLAIISISYHLMLLSHYPMVQHKIIKTWCTANPAQFPVTHIASSHHPSLNSLHHIISIL